MYIDKSFLKKNYGAELHFDEKKTKNNNDLLKLI